MCQIPVLYSPIKTHQFARPKSRQAAVMQAAQSADSCLHVISSFFINLSLLFVTTRKLMCVNEQEIEASLSPQNRDDVEDR